MRLMFAAASLAVTLLLAVLLVAAPQSQPSRPETGNWIADFRIAHYLDLAIEIQQLAPDSRVARLREIAADKSRASEIFPLCRMLFDARKDGAFRRPNIGGANFIDRAAYDNTAYADWPLEPITLYEGLPILVARAYFGGGRGPEPADDYLKYCLDNCQWRDMKFAHMEPADVRKKVEAFLAAHPKITPENAELVRVQAQ
jgi:hypothetical protein